MNPNDEVRFEREIDAPRELVWRAWTDPELFKQWFSPKSFVTPDCTMDARVGGKILYSIQGADGRKIWYCGEYKEFVPPSRFTLEGYFSDEHGNPVASASVGMPEDWSNHLKMTIDLEEKDNKTLMLVRQSISLKLAKEAKFHEGWHSTVDKLDQLVESLQGVAQ